MDCRRCGRKNCTMASVTQQLCQLCYNYTPEKSLESMLQDFLNKPAVSQSDNSTKTLTETNTNLLQQ